MHRALDLAEEVAGGLAPRPPVGAVIVAPDGKSIVGEGATQPNPGPHAEAVAITNASDDTQRRNHLLHPRTAPNHSTTPPCSQAIIDAGIKRVICPTTDPNPQVAGRGFEHLRAAGIEVINDVDDTSAQRANVPDRRLRQTRQNRPPLRHRKMGNVPRRQNRHTHRRFQMDHRPYRTRPRPPTTLPIRRHNHRHRNRPRRQPTPNRPRPKHRPKTKPTAPTSA